MPGPTESSSGGLTLAGTDPLSCNRDRLLALVRSYGSCAVAFSGGVDSAVVAMAAHLSLGEQAVAVTGRSPSLASDELELARQQAVAIGIRHEIVDTQEMSQAAYVRNAGDRCYHCKTELYSYLEGLSDRCVMAVVANVANAED